MMAAMQQPNLILITADQLRGDCLGINGHPDLRTHFLDHLAARGVNFRQARTSCPVCIPARRSLLSGLHVGSHGLNRNKEADPFRPPATLPGLLGRAGYQTQLIGKFHVSVPGERLGFDHIVQSETPNDRRHSVNQRRNDYADWFDRVSDAPHTLYQGIMSNDRSSRPWTLPEHHHHTNWVTEEAVRFLGTTRDPSAPFFLHLSYWAPHQPAIPPQCYYDRYADPIWEPRIGSWVPAGEAEPGLALSAQRGPFTRRDMRDHARGYFGLINHLDDQLNALVDRWSCSRLYDRSRPTWICFTADHGEQLGDHHLFRKCAPYEGSQRVPFILAPLHGATCTSAVSDDLVGLEDVLPTFCRLAGLDVPDHLGPSDGIDLTPALEGRSTGRQHQHGECWWTGKHHRSVVSGGLKYIRWTATGEEQVFDLKADPHELVDRSAEVDLSALRALVDAQRDASGTKTSDGDAPLRPAAGRLDAIWA